MRITIVAIALCLAGATVIIPAVSASAQSCDQLWYERNSIYKTAGYCFKTPRAISTFGNAGCLHDSEDAVPLSPDQRERIAWIVGIERQYGCR
jgi:hypothetical protein